ncbi:MAG: hypothetical protein QOD06_2115 [Candidatus Binatota bacterium]|nr:hypothetical protein [Candidatus Binatota bacterium]
MGASTDRAPHEIWEPEIAALEERARRRPPRDGEIVFAGSSSIRSWSTLERDMAPLPVLNRGFGGAQADAILYFAPRIIVPSASGGLVLYAGENDLEAHNRKTAERVLADVRAIVALVEERHPAARIYLVSVKPSPARRTRWREARRLNDLLGTFAAESPRRAYLDVATPTFDARGRRRRELFLEDGLHLSPAGYALWTAVIRPRLLADFATGRG